MPADHINIQHPERRGGAEAENVTEEMKAKARDAEWRDPEPAYREATSREKYDAAAFDQRRKRPT